VTSAVLLGGTKPVTVPQLRKFYQDAWKVKIDDFVGKFGFTKLDEMLRAMKDDLYVNQTPNGLLISANIGDDPVLRRNAEMQDIQDVEKVKKRTKRQQWSTPIRWQPRSFSVPRPVRPMVYENPKYFKGPLSSSLHPSFGGMRGMPPTQSFPPPMNGFAPTLRGSMAPPPRPLNAFHMSNPPGFAKAFEQMPSPSGSQLRPPSESSTASFDEELPRASSSSTSPFSVSTGSLSQYDDNQKVRVDVYQNFKLYLAESVQDSGNP
jgi:hypothetical protein